MKLVYSLIFLLPFLAFGQAPEGPQLVSALELEGKEIFIMHKPATAYEVVGTVHAENQKGLFIDNVKELIAVANDEFGSQSYDAILTRGAFVGMCIKYTAIPNHLGEEMQMYEKDLFFYANPRRPFTKVGELELEDGSTLDFSQYCRAVVALAKEQEVTIGRVDGVISHDGVHLELIRFDE